MFKLGREDRLGDRSSWGCAALLGICATARAWDDLGAGTAEWSGIRTGKQLARHGVQGAVLCVCLHQGNVA